LRSLILSSHFLMPPPAKRKETRAACTA
jgi:hypothetical protein